MGEWGFLIALLVGAWLLQIIFTYYQNRHYGQTVKEMSQTYDQGYLGVGVVKKRLGVGSVVILVSDLTGKIMNAKELTGVTVFSRFRPVPDLVGVNIKQLGKSNKSDHRTQAIKMAITQIEKQEQKKEDTIVNESTE